MNYKGVFMKSRIAKTFALFSFAMALAVTAAHAQSTSDIKFHIPFDSVAGKANLPAGDYTVRVESGTATKIIRIRNADGKYLFTTGFSMPTRSRELSAQGKLVFNRYGDQYFLSQVWQPGVSNGQALPRSGAEREVAKNAQIAKSREAEQGQKKEEVFIASQN